MISIREGKESIEGGKLFLDFYWPDGLPTVLSELTLFGYSGSFETPLYPLGYYSCNLLGLYGFITFSADGV